MIDVSIVIVCMNKPDNLRVCLPSIQKYTNVSYEVFVVAYLFSKENLAAIKTEYSWVKIIESNEIRGFSENNNLALRQASGKYCFVLNDDTEMRMPVVDKLVETIEKLPEKVAIISPNILRADGSVQCCGRPRYDWKTFVFHYVNKHSPYVNKIGIFQSYNVLGAAFMIKTEVFKTIGWFDESYFFTPEDIALSTGLNKQGYECWVNSEIELIHYEGMSGKSLSMIKTATAPAARRGLIMFYSNGSWLMCLFLNFVMLVKDILAYIIDTIAQMTGRATDWINIRRIISKNLIQIAFTNKTPKEIFIKYYNSLS